jgi:predicted transposase YbfD/YdcC
MGKPAAKVSTQAGENGRKKTNHKITRKLWWNLDDAIYLKEVLGLADCQIVRRVDYREETFDGEIISQERRYYIASLDPSKVSPKKLLRLIRGHWQVENCLHFIKDRWWDEDRHWTSRPGLAAVFASLTNAAISVLRLFPGETKEQERILRAKAEQVQWNPKNVLNTLGFKK